MSLRLRLSVMMFLQYAIWGAWLPILYPFLLGHRHFSLDQVGWILAAGAAGAIVGPFIAGQVADRWMATEKFLGICHLAGAVLVWYLATVDTYTTFLVLSLTYGVIYTPTLALTNSLALAHLKDPDRDFGPIRVWGTVGWIAAGIGMGQWLLMKHTPSGVSEELIKAAQDAGRADAFRLSAILGALMGFYSFLLPHTPPSKSAHESNASLRAMGEFRRQPLLTLFLIAVPVSIVHQFYFVHTSEFLTQIQNKFQGAEGFATSVNRIFGVGGGGLMTIGQMGEILVLAAMPLAAKRLSRKSLLLVGLLAYAGRMALFSYAASSLPAILFALALHGLCFGCFIFVAYLVVNEHTTKDVRASAQNLFNLVIFGVGIIVGSKFATEIGKWAKAEDGSMDFTKLFS
ncbi:MAG TPA: MFS transporter, partial [Planctomycetota bacterium]|nr:MFS transporter [Planctomycetota bacterium]